MTHYVEEVKATNEPISEGAAYLKRRAKIVRSKIGVLHMDNHSRVADAIIGDNCVIMRDSIVRHATIGADCYIGRNCEINTGNPDHWIGEALDTSVSLDPPPGRVIIGDRVRIGGGVRVASGVTIGHDALIEPGSAVFDDVPAGATVRGNPAKII